MQNKLLTYHRKTRKLLLSPGTELGLAYPHQPSTALLFVKNLVSSSDVPFVFWHCFSKACKINIILSLPVSFKEDQSLFSHKILSTRSLHCHCLAAWTGLDCFVQLLPLGLWHPLEQHISTDIITTCNKCES